MTAEYEPGVHVGRGDRIVRRPEEFVLLGEGPPASGREHGEQQRGPDPAARGGARSPVLRAGGRAPAAGGASRRDGSRSPAAAGGFAVGAVLGEQGMLPLQSSRPHASPSPCTAGPARWPGFSALDTETAASPPRSGRRWERETDSSRRDGARENERVR